MRRIGGILLALALLAGCRYETITQAPAASPPAAPANLTVTAVTASSVSLAWSPVDGATGYQVLRNGAKAATLADASCTDSGLSAATAYQYTVQASNAAGSSAPYAPPVMATTAAPAWSPLPGHVYILAADGAILYDANTIDTGDSYPELLSLVGTYVFPTVNASHGGTCTLIGGGP